MKPPAQPALGDVRDKGTDGRADHLSGKGQTKDLVFGLGPLLS